MNKKQKIWLNTQIENLYIRGYTEQQIADKLKVKSQPTISRILGDMQARAKNNVIDLIENELPSFYLRSFNGYNELLRIAWQSLETDESIRKDPKLRHSYIELIANLYEREEKLLTGPDIIKGFLNYIEDSKRQAKEDREETQRLVCSLKSYRYVASQGH